VIRPKLPRSQKAHSLASTSKQERVAMQAGEQWKTEWVEDTLPWRFSPYESLFSSSHPGRSSPHTRRHASARHPVQPNTPSSLVSSANKTREAKFISCNMLHSLCYYAIHFKRPLNWRGTAPKCADFGSVTASESDGSEFCLHHTCIV